VARLRYSDRKQLAEAGTLGDLTYDTVSDELATATRSLIQSSDPAIRTTFEPRLSDALVQHLGIGQSWSAYFGGGMSTDTFLDAVEIAAEEATRQINSRSPIPDVEEGVNRIFERFRFGYRMEGGEIRKVGSPALEVEIVGPALLAVQRPGWEQAERSFREALSHQRSGESDDALTAASAAVEAALKAAGMRGNTLKQLAKSFKGAGIVPGYLSNVPELIEDLLDRLQAMRSTSGDAHGKAPGAEEVPAELADLGIHWAAAFIAYLADVTE